MTCDESRTYLAAYLDDELDVGQCLQVQKHLAECAGCRRAQEEHDALRAALRDPELYGQPSAEFAQRIQAAVRGAAREEERRQRSSWFAGFWIAGPQLAAAAVLLVVAAVAGTMLFLNRGARSPEQLIADAALAGHIRSLQPGHLVDVPSSDHHTVKPWFQGKLDFSPPVPDLSSVGGVLTGGRLDYLDGHPVAALVYRRRFHDINVFLWPNRGPADETIRHETSQGYQILHWKSSDMNYWVVSDLNPAELTELARALQRQ